MAGHSKAFEALAAHPAAMAAIFANAAHFARYANDNAGFSKFASSAAIKPVSEQRQRLKQMRVTLRNEGTERRPTRVRGDRQLTPRLLPALHTTPTCSPEDIRSNRPRTLRPFRTLSTPRSSAAFARIAGVRRPFYGGFGGDPGKLKSGAMAALNGQSHAASAMMANSLGVRVVKRAFGALRRWRPIQGVCGACGAAEHGGVDGQSKLLAALRQSGLLAGTA